MSADGSHENGSLKGMYEDYFLDYASYVILERAVPAIEDGLKPVQRRILHAMRQMHDGRYHKVANIIGQTMQFHPHGDAAIGDALVKMGQKELLIDPQGNWGDTRTGDPSAAPRYIEARLTDFALEVAFNPKTTEWQLAYDGRKEEPVHLPMKFPLVLAMGVDGIAVGLSTKILPHNFVELLESSIKLLQGKRFTLYPDFDTGGSVDVSDYNDGKRGGRVKVRAKIEIEDKNTLLITELPYGVTTDSIIDSILKANDKGKIKIKQVVDNTAKDVEIAITLHSGTSPEITMDALYAFTRCEESISPNACVIMDDRPHFMTVSEILEVCTNHTMELLKKELEIRKAELEEQIHLSSLIKIFIEKRIYRRIEECETWDAVIATIEEGLHEYISTPNRPNEDAEFELIRDITEEDIVKLTEIKIKRISKYDVKKADERMNALEEELAQVEHDLANLVDYTVAYFQRLIDKFGEGRERKTKITSFETIERAQVVANNAKLYVNRKDGFIGTGLKKEEYVTDCSDIDDIIVFKRDGSFKVVKVDDKVYVGKNIIHIAVWQKGDERTTYNMMYVDGKSGWTYGKRFHVKAIVRDRDYDLTTGEKGSKCLYFSANPNGEAEVVNIQLTQSCRARKKNFDYDFSDLDIKGRTAKGNIITKYPVHRIKMEEEGKSTLGALKVWMDDVSGRLNTEERGDYIGAYDTGDHILVLYKDGSYELKELDLNIVKIPLDDVIYVYKYDPDSVISCIYYDGERKWSIVKRFEIETSTTNQKFTYITEHRSSQLLGAYIEEHPVVTYSYKSKGETYEETVDLVEFIDVKGWRSIGNKLSDYKIKIKDVEFVDEDEDKDEDKDKDDTLKAGDTIEFDVDEPDLFNN
jgi:topoisomerase-4 subunit A